jgi:hypothetical protein
MHLRATQLKRLPFACTPAPSSTFLACRTLRCATVPQNLHSSELLPDCCCLTYPLTSSMYLRLASDPLFMHAVRRSLHKLDDITVPNTGRLWRSMYTCLVFQPYHGFGCKTARKSVSPYNHVSALLFDALRAPFVVRADEASSRRHLSRIQCLGLHDTYHAGS